MNVNFHAVLEKILSSGFYCQWRKAAACAKSFSLVAKVSLETKIVEKEREKKKKKKK